jgi:hypothetical protein
VSWPIAVAGGDWEASVDCPREASAARRIGRGERQEQGEGDPRDGTDSTEFFFSRFVLYLKYSLLCNPPAPLYFNQICEK